MPSRVPPATGTHVDRTRSRLANARSQNTQGSGPENERNTHQQQDVLMRCKREQHLPTPRDENKFARENLHKSANE